MKEELQSKLVEILSSIQAAAGKAGDFAMAQLPDIAQSYVVYGRVRTLVESGLMLLVGITLLSFALWAYLKPWNSSTYSCDAGNKRSDSNIASMIFSGGGGFIFSVAAFAAFDWLVWLAPKVWLLQQLAHMVR